MKVIGKILALKMRVSGGFCGASVILQICNLKFWPEDTKQYFVKIKRILSLKYYNPNDELLIQYKEEYVAWRHNYYNQGLYPESRTYIIDRMMFYGGQVDKIPLGATHNRGYIYSIPRLW